MTTVGTMKQSTDEKTRRQTYIGDVRLIGVLNGRLYLLPHPNFVPGRSDENHPMFVAEYQPRGEAHTYEVGAGWQKAMKGGGEFVSVTIDMPQWDKPLNLAMFPPNAERGEKDWRLQWSRPRGGEQSEQQAA